MRRDEVENEGWYRGGDDVEDEGRYRGGDEWGSRARNGNRLSRLFTTFYSITIIVTKKKRFFFHKIICLIQSNII